LTKPPNRSRNLLLMLLFLVATYAALYVWPTLYRYDHIGVIPVRWNRITDGVEYLSLQGWQPALPMPENGVPTFRR
jgi:hypothetical protein